MEYGTKLIVQIAFPPPEPCEFYTNCNGSGGSGRWVWQPYRDYTGHYLINSIGNSHYVQYEGSSYVIRTRHVWVPGNTSPGEGPHEHVSSGNGGHPTSSPHPNAFLKAKAELWEDEVCEKPNFQSNDCVQGIWQEMKKLNVGYETLIRFTGQEPVAELCIDIKDLDTDANGVAGRTGPAEVTININSGKLDRSKLSIARTMLHEMIHAELHGMMIEAGGYNDLQNYAANYQGDDPFMMIWQYYEEHGNYIADQNPGWQHEYMADYYIEYMAKGLKKLHPELSSQAFIDYEDGTNVFDKSWNWDEFFIALAWQGLEGTIEYKNKVIDTGLEKYYDFYTYELSVMEVNKCE